ncbi:MAG: prolipoprotein diacylglyceryl transferase [Firmicutes bacterium]|nr:prolipoprotein diacylglyceryl transferase [Bacillota bacterium]
MLPRILFDLGFIKIYTFGFTVAMGIVLGTYFSLRLVKQKGLSKELIIDTLLYGFIAGIIGARLIYVLLNLSEYLAEPTKIIHIEAGGMSLHGGLLGGLLVVIYQGIKNKVSIWDILDVLSPGIALAIAIGRIGCDLYGIPTELPWGIYYQGVKVHPIQAYSFIFNLGLFYYLWRKSKENIFKGAVFLRFIIVYSVFRFFLEYVRGGDFIWELFNAGQITSMALILLAGLIYWNSLRKTIK